MKKRSWANDNTKTTLNNTLSAPQARKVFSETMLLVVHNSTALCEISSQTPFPTSLRGGGTSIVSFLFSLRGTLNSQKCVRPDLRGIIGSSELIAEGPGTHAGVPGPYVNSLLFQKSSNGFRPNQSTNHVHTGGLLQNISKYHRWTASAGSEPTSNLHGTNLQTIYRNW